MNSTFTLEETLVNTWNNIRSIASMNSELLYPKSQIWKKNRIEKENWNIVHKRKEIVDCMCEKHKIPWVKNDDLSSVIILKLSWKTYTVKDYMVSTPSPFSGGIFIAFPSFPNRHSGIKIGYNEGRVLTVSYVSFWCSLYERPDNDIWSVRWRGTRVSHTPTWLMLTIQTPWRETTVRVSTRHLENILWHWHHHFYWGGASWMAPKWRMVCSVLGPGSGVETIS